MDALKVLLRRWYIVSAGALLTAAAGVGVLQTVPPQYQASGELILLLNPQATGARTPTNPYLNLQQGLVTTASIISSSLMTPQEQKKLADKGYTAEYSADVLPDSGPILVVTAKSSDRKLALRTRDAVLEELGLQLKNIQTAVNVPEKQMISPLPSNVAPEAQALPGSKIRALGAVGATGIVATLIVTFTVDGRSRRRRAKNGAEQESGAGPTDRTPPDGDLPAEPEPDSPAARNRGRGPEPGTRPDPLADQRPGTKGPAVGGRRRSGPGPGSPGPRRPVPHERDGKPGGAAQAAVGRRQPDHSPVDARDR